MKVVRSSASPADRVLDAAHELFTERNIDAVGVDTISARSGVSKSTLYRHFPTKAELVAAYLRRSHERRLPEWAAVVTAGGGPPEERLLAVFDWIEAWFADEAFHGCRFINAAVQIPDPDHPAGAVPRQHKEAVRQLFVDLGRQAEVEDPDELAHELMLLIDGAVVHAVLEGSPAPASRAKGLARLALRARSPAGTAAL